MPAKIYKAEQGKAGRRKQVKSQDAPTPSQYWQQPQLHGKNPTPLTWLGAILGHGSTDYNSPASKGSVLGLGSLPDPAALVPATWSHMLHAFLSC